MASFFLKTEQKPAPNTNYMYLRKGQTPEEIKRLRSGAQQPKLTYWTFPWVREALNKLHPYLKGQTFVGKDDSGVIQPFTIGDEPITLRQLVMIARNEPSNTSGIIGEAHLKAKGVQITGLPDEKAIFDLSGIDAFYPGIMNAQGDEEKAKEGQRDIIYSLTDLAKFVSIIGPETATKYGGYPQATATNPGNPLYKYETEQPAYLCDLIGLQFQAAYNTGRLLFIPQDPKKKPQGLGVINQIILKNIIDRDTLPTYEDIEKLKDEKPEEFAKYVLINDSVWGKGYFHKEFYQQVVARDVILSGTGLNQRAAEEKSTFEFRFLSYGTGAFVSVKNKDIRREVQSSILQGMHRGLQPLARVDRAFSNMTHATLTHYQGYDRHAAVEIKTFYETQGVEYTFSSDIDALGPNTLIAAKNKPSRIGLTGNTDGRAVMGNEDGYSSVDGALARNTKDHCNRLTPHSNTNSEERYLDVPAIMQLADSKEGPKESKQSPGELTESTSSTAKRSLGDFIYVPNPDAPDTLRLLRDLPTTPEETKKVKETNDSTTEKSCTFFYTPQQVTKAVLVTTFGASVLSAFLLSTLEIAASNPNDLWTNATWAENMLEADAGLLSTDDALLVGSMVGALIAFTYVATWVVDLVKQKYCSTETTEKAASSGSPTTPNSTETGR